MAPMYANTYMRVFEKEHILHPYREQIVQYVRFIDDILILWKGSVVEAEQFVKKVNCLPSPIKITANISDIIVQYLDLEIFIKDSRIEYQLYSKPTDRNTILHFKSAHPEHSKKSLPYTQFLRVFWNNSLVERVENQVDSMYNKFLTRGYNRHILDVALDKARLEMANTMNIQQQPRAPRLTFPMKFNSASTKLVQAVKGNWNILTGDPSLPTIFSQNPMICYKREKNLRDLLVRTDPEQSYLRNQ
ncbi:Hypothetical predicted protein, partial [Pelobates cultripes]